MSLTWLGSATDQVGEGKVQLAGQLEVPLHIIPAAVSHFQDQLQGRLVNETSMNHLPRERGQLVKITYQEKMRAILLFIAESFAFK